MMVVPFGFLDRLCKGILKAWEQWIKETEEDQHLKWKSSATKDDFTVQSKL